MISAYPMAAIGVGAAAAYAVATLAGTIVARAGFPVTPAARRLGCLDGLRGYLALSVLVHHFVIWLQITRLGGTWSAPDRYILFNIGAGGVALFFMITGCVFYPRVLAGLRGTSWTGLLIGRLFRIVPLAVVSILIIIGMILRRGPVILDRTLPDAVLAWVTGYGEPPLLAYPDSGRLNAYVLWSLWYEWVFYILVLPLCALAMDLVRNRLPSWTVPVALLAVGMVLRHMPSWGLLPTFLPLFAIGMLAHECQARSRLRHLLATKGLGVAAGIALVTGLSTTPTPYGPGAMALCGLFFIAVACGNDMGGVLRTRGALVLGECSYGIYLLHGIVLSLVFVEWAPLFAPLSTRQLPLLLPGVALVVCLITPVTYLLVERRANEVGHALARRRPSRTSGVGPGPELKGAKTQNT